MCIDTSRDILHQKISVCTFPELWARSQHASWFNKSKQHHICRISCGGACRRKFYSIRRVTSSCDLFFSMDSLSHRHQKKKIIVFVQSRKRKKLDTAGEVLAAGHTIRIKGASSDQILYIAARSRNRRVSNFFFPSDVGRRPEPLSPPLWIL